MSKMMRISDVTAKNLEQLSKKMGKSKQSIIEKAVDSYLREVFLKKANEEWADLERKGELNSLKTELEDWNVTLSDGLDRL